MGRKLGNSLVFKVWVPMCGVLILGALLFGATLVGGGSVRQLEDNAYDILSEKVLSRRNRLQNDMVQYWSNLSGHELEIVQAISAYLGEDQSLDSLTAESGAALLSDLLPRLVTLLRADNATGVFVVLNAATRDEVSGDLLRPGLYLRDLDPHSNPVGPSDLLLERGPASVANIHNIPLDAPWETRFRFSDAPLFEHYSADFYEKPLAALAAHPSRDSRDLGYWSRPFSLSPNDLSVITYSVPLIASNGEVLGVLGTEVSIDYLREWLPHDELHSKYGGYLLAIEGPHDGGDTFVLEPIAYAGPILASAIGGGEQVRFSVKEQRPGLREMLLPDGSPALCGSFEPLSLYNSNTLFVSEGWRLIGIMRADDLLQSARDLTSQLMLALLSSTLVGGLLVFGIAKRFTRPITRLADQVRVIDPTSQILLPPVGISEIDELSSAIESMSREVAGSASRMSQIIALTNMPIAAFERDGDAQTVFFTGLFRELAGVELLPGDDPQSMPLVAFDAVLRQLLSQPEPGDAGVFRVERPGVPVRWLRVVARDEDARQLGVLADVTRETLDRRRIEHERDYDTLTLLLNRRAFTSRVRPLFDTPETLKVAAFVMWDLDNLKYINDTYGHDMGDEYLRLTAGVLKDFSLYNGIAARMSGDEFYAFLYGYQSREGIRQVLDTIRTEMDAAALPLPDGSTLHIRASAGVAWFPEDATTYEQLLKAADFAMYEVKNSFKGTTRDFDCITYERDSVLLNGREELNSLIEQRLVRFAFQPIVDARTGEIFAYEGLMRPQVPHLSSPLDVLRVARTQSRLYQIERLTWFEALKEVDRRSSEFGTAKLFFNSIPNYAMLDSDIEFLEKSYPSLLPRVVIEIIESEQTDGRCCLSKQEAARRWGAQLALDDFGAGYSNDLVLLTLAPDYVKVDMSIVRGIEHDQNRRQLLANLLSYSRERGIKVIAEGVESAAELTTLVRLGVDYLQGYFLGMPGFDPPREVLAPARQAIADSNAELSAPQ